MSKQRDRFYVNNNAIGWQVINTLRAEAKEYNKIERRRAAANPNYKPVFKNIALYGRQPITPGARVRVPLDEARKIAVYVNAMVERKTQFNGTYKYVEPRAKFNKH